MKQILSPLSIIKMKTQSNSDSELVMRVMNELLDLHNKLLSKVDELNKVSISAEEVKKILMTRNGPKGDKGDKGDMPAIDYDRLIKELQNFFLKNSNFILPQGAKGDKGDKGDTPKIDYEKVAKLAAKFVKPNTVIQSDPKLGSIEKPQDVQIKETETAMENYLRKYGYRPYVSGSGIPSLAAGTGIQLVKNSDGGYTVVNTSSGAGTAVYNEEVSGSGTSWTLANTPGTGSLRLFANGQRLKVTTDYTLSGANITTTQSWDAGSLLADYVY